MMRLAVVWLVMFLVSLVLPSSMLAQVDAPTAQVPDVIGTLTVTDLVLLGMLIISLVGSVSAAVYAYMTNQHVREMGIRGLDLEIASGVQERRSDVDAMEVLEKLVNGMAKDYRESLREMAEIAVDATKYIPVETLRELAALSHEAVDGVPIREKLAAQAPSPEEISSDVADTRKALEETEQKLKQVLGVDDLGEMKAHDETNA